MTPAGPLLRGAQPCSLLPLAGVGGAPPRQLRGCPSGTRSGPRQACIPVPTTPPRQVDKHRIVTALGIRYRDLLALDPSVPIPFPAAILIREKALVVNLETVGARPAFVARSARATGTPACWRHVPCRQGLCAAGLGGGHALAALGLAEQAAFACDLGLGGPP